MFLNSLFILCISLHSYQRGAWPAYNSILLLRRIVCLHLLFLPHEEKDVLCGGGAEEKELSWWRKGRQLQNYANELGRASSDDTKKQFCTLFPLFCNCTGRKSIQMHWDIRWTKAAKSYDSWCHRRTVFLFSLFPFFPFSRYTETLAKLWGPVSPIAVLLSPEALLLLLWIKGW